MAPLALLISQPALAQTNIRYESFRFGVCYYPEQWPESYWEEDARRMKACGVNTVRLGEFGWAIMEPRPGHYDFALFDHAIATLGRYGIKTIFGTPTATPPKWLTQKHPDVLHVFETGQRATFAATRTSSVGRSTTRSTTRIASVSAQVARARFGSGSGRNMGRSIR
jgi:beta-galactosidase